MQALLHQPFAQSLFVQRPLLLRIIHNRPMLKRFILSSIVCAFVMVGAPVRAQSAADTVLLDMQQAYQKGDRQRLRTSLPRVQGHILEPWAAYWELSARLTEASAEEVQAFFDRYPGTYQEDRLRNDWLLLLGERQEWARFAAHANQYRMNDDPEVRCHTLAMEHQLAGVNMAAEVKTQWHAQSKFDPGCTQAAKLHHEARLLDDADVWLKARLSAERGQFNTAEAALAIVAPQAAATWRDLWSAPQRFVLTHSVTGQRQTQELAVLALTRWAANAPQDAARALQHRWADHLSPDQLAWTWGAIGSAAARRLSDDAPDYFARADAQRMHDEHLVWRARSALRQQRWDDVLACLNAMSPARAQEDTWVYWRARALLQPERSVAEQEQARTLLSGLASLRGFYPMLAQEELGLPLLPPPAPAPLTAQEKERARTNPGLQRALAAIALGLRSEGVREWNYTTNLHTPGGMNERDLLAAADLACQNAIWDRCINTSERTRTVFDLAQRYPTPHRDEVLARSQVVDIDPAYVYGLIRQESRFIVDARSSVGAAGLMQVMPKTARWTAKKIGLSNFKPQQLAERDVNIAIGTGYLKLVLDDFAGSMPLAAAAYNAGPSRSRSWRGQAGAPTLEAAIWIETIPFAETRDYVKKVLANTTIYDALLNARTPSLKQRLGQIGPRSDTTPENQDLP